MVRGQPVTSVDESTKPPNHTDIQKSRSPPQSNTNITPTTRGRSRAVVTSGITGRVEGRAIKITDSECGSMNVKGGEWRERVNASSTNVISRVERENPIRLCVCCGSFVVDRSMQQHSTKNDKINERRCRQLTCRSNLYAYGWKYQISRRMQRKRDKLMIEESQRVVVEKGTEMEWQDEVRRDVQADSPTKCT